MKALTARQAVELHRAADEMTNAISLYMEHHAQWGYNEKKHRRMDTAILRFLQRLGNFTDKNATSTEKEPE